jgi:predicted RNA-binding Zn-ribbon protein involved in translation (DUF1610 family)
MNDGCEQDRFPIFKGCKVIAACTSCGAEKIYKRHEAIQLKNPYRCKSCTVKHRVGENALGYRGGKTTIKCTKCGKERQAAAWEISKFKSEKYVCRDCYRTPTGEMNPNWRGGEKKKVKKIRTGEHNPNWKGGSKIMVCRDCGAEKRYDRTWANKFEQRDLPYRCVNCQPKYYTGENSPHWIDGRTFEARPQEWNEELRNTIRARDGFICQICGQPYTKRRMPVHHINYDKHNLSHDNLIALCTPCHGKTSHRRGYWQELLVEKMLSKAGAISNEISEQKITTIEIGD